MKRCVLSRYERDNDGNTVIDVSTARIEDLYNDFDKSAPYIRRDLNQDFADYLVDCAQELGRIPFIIRLTMAVFPDEVRSSRIRRSLNTFFVYLGETEMQMMRQKFRRAVILFALGFSILVASVWLNRLLGSERSVTANVSAEGLTVAAWVSLWEALGIFLIGWFPHRKRVTLYQRLAHARLIFRATTDTDPNRSGETANQSLDGTAGSRADVSASVP